MVTKRKDYDDEGLLASMTREHKRFLDTHKAIRTEWYVVEVTPRSEDDYGSYVAEYSIVVSPYFDTQEAAEGWTEDHVADNGKTLEVAKRVLRETVVREWYSF